MKTQNGRLCRHFHTVRLVLYVIVVIAMVGGLATPVKACGIITHHYIAEQAFLRFEDTEYYPLYEILQNHPGELTYGSVFPDWGYATGKGALADYAHTTEFTTAYINDLAKRLSRPFSDEDQKEIAFLFGVIAHNEADKYFHPMGPDYFNFLEAARSPLYGNMGDGVEEWKIEEDVDLFVRDAYEGYLIGDYCVGWNLPNKAKQVINAAYKTYDPSLNVTETDLLIGYDRQGTACKWEALEPRDVQPWIDQNFFNYPGGVNPPIQGQGHGGLQDLEAHVAEAYMQTWDSFTPVTSLSLSPTEPDGNNSWYRHPVTMTLNATALFNGPIVTQYNLNWSGEQQYTAPVELPVDGKYGIYYWSGYAVDPTKNVEAGKYETINIDMTPPWIHGAPNSQPNTNGWYHAPVKVHFRASDALSGLDTLTPGQTLTSEGAGQSVMGVAVDLAGNSASFTVEPINIDLAPPVVDVWVDQPSYTRTESMIIHFNGSDSLAGMESLTAELNGQPVVDGQTIDLFRMPAGVYSLTARGEDLAGWVTVKSQSIKMYATIESLQGTVKRLCQEGYIAKNGTCKELSVKLAAALDAMDRDQLETAVQNLRALQNALRAQTGKSITDEAAWLLLMDSDYVIEDLKP